MGRIVNLGKEINFDLSSYAPLTVNSSIASTSGSLVDILNVAGEGFIKTAVEHLHYADQNQIVITIDGVIVVNLSSTASGPMGIVDYEKMHNYTTAGVGIINFGSMGSGVTALQTPTLIYPQQTAVAGTIIVGQPLFFKKSARVQIQGVSGKLQSYMIDGGIK